MALSVLEICAGAGGHAIGADAAGLRACGLVEVDAQACETLLRNRPEWPVIQADVRAISGRAFRGVDVLAGGVPCPPFSIAGKQLGSGDERDLFPEALRLVEEARPAAVVLENVPGFASARFAAYRGGVLSSLCRLGYDVEWRILHASRFGVAQLRPRFVLVALRPRYAEYFNWPEVAGSAVTVADAIGDLMGAEGWRGAARWRRVARGIAPTIVGGSRKHGGPDLGPTRARRQWAALGVDGLGIADGAPGPDFPIQGRPRLTLRMVARLQGFPDCWLVTGGKTAAYRQIGNAFPPPVARAVAESVRDALAGVRVARQGRLLGCAVAAV